MPNVLGLARMEFLTITEQCSHSLQAVSNYAPIASRLMVGKRLGEDTAGRAELNRPKISQTSHSATKQRE